MKYKFFVITIWCGKTFKTFIFSFFPFRYLVVCKPLKLVDMYDIKRALKVIAVISAVLLILHLHFAWTVQVVYFPYDESLIPQCAAGMKYLTLIEEVWPWVDALIYSFVPFVLILLFNSCIIRQISNANRLRREITSEQISTTHSFQQYLGSSGSGYGGSTSITSRSRFAGYDSGKLTVMLLTISFAFLLTTLPANISLIASNVWTPNPRDLHQLAQFRLFRTITELLMYLNHSCNFYLYCASGRKFRVHLCRLFRLHKYACGYTNVQVLHTNKPEHMHNNNCPAPGGHPGTCSRRGSRHVLVHHGIHQGVVHVNGLGLKHLGPPGSSSRSSSRSPNAAAVHVPPPVIQAGPYKRSQSS